MQNLLILWLFQFFLPFGHEIDVSPDGENENFYGNQYLNIYDISSINNDEKENIVFDEVEYV